MKTLLNRLALFSFVILLFSCEAKSRMGFENGWTRLKESNYSYTSVKGNEKADLWISFAVDREYQYDNFIFELEVISPDTLYMVDSLSIVLDSLASPTIKGEYVTDKRLISGMLLKQGTYQFIVKQRMNDTLWNVMRCDLIVLPEK